MVEMHLVGVRVEMPTNSPIVLLRESEGQHRVLPIFIGPPEAQAIALARAGCSAAVPGAALSVHPFAFLCLLRVYVAFESGLYRFWCTCGRCGTRPWCFDPCGPARYGEFYV